MPNGGEADWSAWQLYGGHWCMCHGEATEPRQDLSVKCIIAKTTHCGGPESRSRTSEEEQHIETVHP